MYKHILNKTKNHSDRLTLIGDGMGGAGDPPYYPTHWCSVASGIDRGSGYQGYMSITHALSEKSWLTEATKAELRATLDALGFSDYLQEVDKEH